MTTTHYSSLIPCLEKGDPVEIENLLWQPATIPIKYMPLTVDTVQRLRKPSSSLGRLQIHSTFSNGNFDLVIFNRPWIDDGIPFSPLIFYRAQSKIAGIMLPFNELLNAISDSDRNSITQLGFAWVNFSLPFTLRAD